MKKKSNKFDIFDKYMLNDKDIKKAIENGLLSERIYTILTYKKSDGYYHIQTLTNAYLHSLGIKVNYTQMGHDGYKLIFESFYITDFYLICCAGKSLDWKFIKKGSNQEKVYNHPDSIKVVPLKDIEYIRAEFDKNINGFSSAVTKKVKKNPAKGAAVGAIIAGASGAVVGAALNSGSKTKTVVPARYYNYDEYALIIKFKDGEEYIYNKFYNATSNSGDISISSKNALAEKLVEQSKKKKTIAEKKKIVSDTISQGKNDLKEEKKSDTIALVIFLAIVFGLIFAFESFC